MEFLSRHVLDQSDEYAKTFANAEPFKHVVIDDFFAPEALALLLEQFPAHGTREGIIGDYGAKNAQKGGKSNVREFGEVYRQWDDYIQSPTFLQLIGKISGIDHLHYDPDYIGAGIHENFPGNRNRIHIDYNYHPRYKWHRRLNAIIYITPDWKEEYGGALKIYENGFKPKDGIRKKLPCLGNRCVLFETNEHSWHGVETIRVPPELDGLTRKSITVYFYTTERAEEETFGRHSTIYTPGELPECATVGRTLSEEDVQALNGYERNTLSLIEGLYGEHARHYRKIEELRALLEEEKALVAAKVESLAVQKEHMAELRARFAERLARNDELKALLAVQKGKLDAANERFLATKGKLEEARQRFAATKAKLDALRAQTS